MTSFPTAAELEELERLSVHLDGMLKFLRDAWLNDGAEGEAVHRVAKVAERVPQLLAAARFALRCEGFLREHGEHLAETAELSRARGAPGRSGIDALRGVLRALPSRPERP